MAHLCLAFAPSLAHGAKASGEFGESIAHLGLLVALVLIAAQVGGELAVRLKQPSVLGELIAGIVLGNLPWRSLGTLASDPFVAMLSQGTARGVSRLSVAFGMMPRGEVCLVFASLGMTLTIDGAPLLDTSGYSALVAVVILTTVLTPMLLRWQLVRDERAAA